MNPFEDCLRNAQRYIPSLMAWTAFSYHEHTGLILERLANFVRTHIPHFGDFGNSIVQFGVRRTHATDRNWLSKRFFRAGLILISQRRVSHDGAGDRCGASNSFRPYQRTTATGAAGLLIM
jgi:hypothetical protein